VLKVKNLILGKRGKEKVVPLLIHLFLSILIYLSPSPSASDLFFVARREGESDNGAF
jgi:hypothetical protein